MRGVKTSAEDILLALQDKVHCLHIHDNDKRHDYHQIPFTGEIDYNPIINALKKIKYNGHLTLEVICNDYSESIESYTKRSFEAVKRLQNMF